MGLSLSLRFYPRPTLLGRAQEDPTQRDCEQEEKEEKFVCFFATTFRFLDHFLQHLDLLADEMSILVQFAQRSESWRARNRHRTSPSTKRKSTFCNALELNFDDVFGVKRFFRVVDQAHAEE